MRTIVISAVNITEAGPLAILRDCLRSLSDGLAGGDSDYRVIAVVHRRDLVNYPHIDYIETRWPKKRWINRLWYEYVSLYRLSRKLGRVDLWFSLHDTTPRVRAARRAVYCHNALFGYRWKFQDLLFAPKMALLSVLTRYIYLPNIHRNDYLVVQQAWFREAMRRMYGFPEDRIIVAPPSGMKKGESSRVDTSAEVDVRSFIYAASPNNHKNFEVICRAVEILERDYGMRDFSVYITVDGKENAYTSWLYKHWGGLECLHFTGFLKKEVLEGYYEKCGCLIFPSKTESWGLPISEFSRYDKYMLLADLPYTHETAGGTKTTAFFDADKPGELAKLMKELIEGETKGFQPVPTTVMAKPIAADWSALFSHLLDGNQECIINN